MRLPCTPDSSNLERDGDSAKILCNCCRCRFLLQDEEYLGHHKETGHVTQELDHLAQIEPESHSLLGGISELSCFFITSLKLYLYLVCGSERIFFWHILNVVGKSSIGKNVWIFVDLVYGIFES